MELYRLKPQEVLNALPIGVEELSEEEKQLAPDLPIWTVTRQTVIISVSNAQIVADGLTLKEAYERIGELQGEPASEESTKEVLDDGSVLYKLPKGKRIKVRREALSKMDDGEAPADG